MTNSPLLFYPGCTHSFFPPHFDEVLKSCVLTIERNNNKRKIDWGTKDQNEEVRKTRDVGHGERRIQEGSWQETRVWGEETDREARPSNRLLTINPDKHCPKENSVSRKKRDLSDSGRQPEHNRLKTWKWLISHKVFFFLRSKFNRGHSAGEGSFQHG